MHTEGKHRNYRRAGPSEASPRPRRRRPLAGKGQKAVRSNPQQRALRELGPGGTSQAGAPTLGQRFRVPSTKVGAGRAEGAHTQESSDRLGVMSGAHSDVLRNTIVFPLGGRPPICCPRLSTPCVAGDK